MLKNVSNYVSDKEFIKFINANSEEQKKLREEARKITQKWFDNVITVRGVIEITNYCNNNCGYCSMAKSNDKLHRYIIPTDKVMLIIEKWIREGIKIFHIVGGETNKVKNDELCKIVNFIYEKGGQVILVTGHKSIEELKQLYDAGAKFYISKFEISNKEKYKLLNNKSGSLDGKLDLLYNLKEIGYKIGTGNIIGLPYQEDEDIYNDLMLIKKLKPFFASTSVFTANKNTKFQDYPNGNIDKTLNYIALTRIMLDYPVYIPTNSSLKEYKNDAFFCGANFTSINLTPEEFKKNYLIYDLKRNDTSQYDRIQKFCKENGFNIKNSLEECYENNVS